MAYLCYPQCFWESVYDVPICSMTLILVFVSIPSCDIVATVICLPACVSHSVCFALLAGHHCHHPVVVVPRLLHVLLCLFQKCTACYHFYQILFTIL